VIYPAAITENVKPASALTTSVPSSRVVEFPAPESKVPPAEALLRELSTPVPAAVPVETTEAPSAVPPAMNLGLVKSLAHQFRKPVAVAALAACAAVIFLVTGMAIIRQRPPAGPAKPPAQDALQVPSVDSASPVAPAKSSLVAASKTDASRSDTRHAIEAITSSPHRDRSKARYNEDAHRRPRSGNADSVAVKFTSPVEPAPLASTTPSRDAAVPSPPVLAVEPVATPRLVTSSPEIDPPRPANPQRRSDCYLLYRVEPLYPREAKAQHIEGTVMIHLQIGADGRVQNLRELSGPSLLVPAALEAAREWRFLPALLNGQPIGAEKDVSIVFQLSP
jgi:TonB family protein